MKSRLRILYTRMNYSSWGVSSSRMPAPNKLSDVSLSLTAFPTVFRFSLSMGERSSSYKSFMRQARENPDPNIRYIAYAKLGSPSIYEDNVQKDEAVKIMLGKLEESKEPVAIRAAIIRSLGGV